nr:hypothetical protein [Streptomyces sp. NBC_00059]
MGEQRPEMRFERDEFGDLGTYVVETVAQEAPDVGAWAFAVVVDGQDLP